jgi:hypothetical protein
MTGMDSREAGVRPYVYFCVVIAALGALNNGFNTVSVFIRMSFGMPHNTITKTAMYGSLLSIFPEIVSSSALVDLE